MITEFKIYESLNDEEPKVGDYVICRTEFNNDLNLFLDNNIGEIIAIDFDFYESYQIYFNDIPESVSIPFSRDNIIYWTNDKYELELKLQANKFNI